MQTGTGDALPDGHSSEDSRNLATRSDDSRQTQVDLHEVSDPEKKQNSCRAELKCIFCSVAAAAVVMLGLLLVFLIVSGQLEGFALIPSSRTVESSSPKNFENLHNNSEDYYVDESENSSHKLEPTDYTFNDTDDTTGDSFQFYNATHYIQYYYIDLNSTDIDFRTENEAQFLEQLRNNDTGIEGIERLEDLNAEALVGGSPQSRGYVAYIPIPINNNEDDGEEEDEEDEEVEPKRKSSKTRNRPVKVPYLVPIMMLPSSAISGNNANQVGDFGGAKFFPGSRNFFREATHHGTYPGNFQTQHGSTSGAYNPHYANSNLDSTSAGSSRITENTAPLGMQRNPMFSNNYRELMQHSNNVPPQRRPSFPYPQSRPNYPIMADRRQNSVVDPRIFGTLANDHLSSSRIHRESFANSDMRNYNLPASRTHVGQYTRRNDWFRSPSGGSDDNYFQQDRHFRVAGRPYDSRRPSRPDYRMDNSNGRPRPIRPSPPHTDNSRWVSKESNAQVRNPMSIQDIISYMTALGMEEKTYTKNSANQYSSSVNYDSSNRGDYQSNNYRNSFKSREPLSVMMDIYPMKEPGSNRYHESQGFKQHALGSYQSSRYPAYRDRERFRDTERDNRDRQADRDRFRNSDVHSRDHYDHQRNSDMHETDYASPSYFSKSPNGYSHSQDYYAKTDEEPKHQVVLHLNLYPRKPNSSGSKTRYGIDRAADSSDADEEYSLSSADIYREVMRNAAAKRDRFPEDSEQEFGASSVKTYREGVRDDGLPGGESRVYVSHKITKDHGVENSKPGPAAADEDDGELYRNHRINQNRQSSVDKYEDGNYELLPLPLPQRDNVSSTDNPVST